MKKIILYCTYLCCLLIISSCEIQDINSEGDNTFSCYINGEAFVPKPQTTISTSPLSKKLEFNRGSFFSIKAKDHDKYSIFILIREFEDKDSHPLKFNNPQNGGNSHAYITVLINGEKYITKDNSGIVTFTNITDNNVEGKFEFTLYNENDNSDKIQVTNGKFND